MQPHRRLILALLLCFVAGALLVAPDRAGGDFSGGLGFELFLALLALAVATRSPRGLTARLGLGPSRLPWSILALLVVGMVSLSYALDGISSLFDLSHGSAIDQLESSLSGIRGRSLSVALLSFALVPGIAEELFFRGLVQRGFQARVRPAIAIVLASLFFGALHMDPIYSILTAVLGLYLGAVAYLAGSVRASIACHATNNAIAVLGTALAPELVPFTLLAILAATTVSIGALRYTQYRLNQMHGRGVSREENPPNSDREGLQRQAGSDDS